MKPTPIKERIVAALNPTGTLNYRNLANEVFPAEDYPNAWNYSSNGGPPGCYMALSSALRRMKGQVNVWWDEYGSRFVTLLREP